MEVNKYLKKLCAAKNIRLIDHTEYIQRQLINKGNLHLNRIGSSILDEAFSEIISEVFK